MLDLNQNLRDLATHTSRRSTLARIGSGLIGAALLASGLPRSATAQEPSRSVGGEARSTSSCTACGGCGSQGCGTWGGLCCPQCLACNGNWCGTTQGNCAAPYPYYGWYWYCCSGGNAFVCQDCCNGSGSCCTAKGLIGSC